MEMTCSWISPDAVPIGSILIVMVGPLSSFIASTKLYAAPLGRSKGTNGMNYVSLGSLCNSSAPQGRSFRNKVVLSALPPL